MTLSAPAANELSETLNANSFIHIALSCIPSLLHSLAFHLSKFVSFPHSGFQFTNKLRFWEWGEILRWRRRELSCLRTFPIDSFFSHYFVFVPCAKIACEWDKVMGLSYWPPSFFFLKKKCARGGVEGVIEMRYCVCRLKVSSLSTLDVILVIAWMLMLLLGHSSKGAVGRIKRAEWVTIRANETGKDVFQRVDLHWRFSSLISTLHLCWLPSSFLLYFSTVHKEKGWKRILLFLPFMVWIYTVSSITSHSITWKGMEVQWWETIWIIGPMEEPSVVQEHRDSYGTRRKEVHINRKEWTSKLLSFHHPSSSCITCHFIHLFILLLSTFFPPYSHEDQQRRHHHHPCRHHLEESTNHRLFLLSMSEWLIHSWIVTSFLLSS